MKQNYILDIDETELLHEYESGEWQEDPNTQLEIDRYRSYATNMLNKNKNVNIRISEADLQKLKARALEEGIPYQTLLSALIHKFVERKIELGI